MTAGGAENCCYYMRGEFWLNVVEVVGDSPTVGTEGGGLFLASVHNRFCELNERQEGSFRRVEERVVLQTENIAVVAEHRGG